MSRPRKLWYRTARQTVNVEIDGKQHPLAKGPDNDETWERARLAYHQLMAEMLANPPVDGGDPTVASIVDEFLDYSVKRDAPSTFYERKLYLQNFCTHHGPRLVRDCKPFHLSKWVDEHPTWISNWTKHYAMRCVVRPFNGGTHCSFGIELDSLRRGLHDDDSDVLGDFDLFVAIRRGHLRVEATLTFSSIGFHGSLVGCCSSGTCAVG